MKIDVFPHIIPVKYKEALYKMTASGAGPVGRREVDKIEILPSLFDLDVRFRIMDQYEGLVQILTLGAPPIEEIAAPKDLRYAATIRRASRPTSSECLGRQCRRRQTPTGRSPSSIRDSSHKSRNRSPLPAMTCRSSPDGRQPFHVGSSKQ